jgi:hypothetical protein
LRHALLSIATQQNTQERPGVFASKPHASISMSIGSPLNPEWKTPFCSTWADLSGITAKVIPFVNLDKVLKFSHQDARMRGSFVC